MRKHSLKRLAIVSGLTLALSFSVSYSCTTVFLNTNNVSKAVARSVDLYVPDQPLLKVFPRGMSRAGEAGENSLAWKSKFGSVVVTEFRTNAVSDGMNEKGLAVHLLYLSGTEYPQAKKEAAKISNLLWAQYILDNYSTVSEAINASKDLQIVTTEANGKTWPLHLSMEDPSGDSAIIEFVKGKMKVYHGSQYQVMTNEPVYNVQIENLKRYQGFGGKLPLPGDPDPLSRFVRVSSFLKTLPEPKTQLEAIAGVLSVMRTAMVPFGAVDRSGNETEDAWATRWVSVADLTNKVYYFNSTSAPNIIWLDLNKADFSEKASVLSIDPTDTTLIGEINKQMKIG